MKRTQSTPRNRKSGGYKYLEQTRRNFLIVKARELGDLPETNLKLQEAYFNEFGEHINRFIAHYYKRLAFGRPQGRTVRSGLRVELPYDDTAKVYRLIEAKRFMTVQEAVSFGISLIKEGEYQSIN